MNNPFLNLEKAKSVAEHISIIFEYQQKSFLNKDKALEIYKTFNLAHPDYYAAVTAKATATNSLSLIDFASDEIIIQNLKSQLLWAVGEEYMKNTGIFSG